MNRIEFLRSLKLVNPVCIELGVYEGVFSRCIIDYLKPKKLYLVDPWEEGYDINGAEKTYDSGLKTAYSNESQYEKVYNDFKQEIQMGKVTMIQNYSYNVLWRFPDQYFDFIYLDACHLHGCVKADLENYLPKLKEDGLMCGHDYIDLFEGLKWAVDEFCEQHKFKMILLSNEGDFALQKQNVG